MLFIFVKLLPEPYTDLCVTCSSFQSQTSIVLQRLQPTVDIQAQKCFGTVEVRLYIGALLWIHTSNLGLDSKVHQPGGRKACCSRQLKQSLLGLPLLSLVCSIGSCAPATGTAVSTCIRQLLAVPCHAAPHLTRAQSHRALAATTLVAATSLASSAAAATSA